MCLVCIESCVGRCPLFIPGSDKRGGEDRGVAQQQHSETPGEHAARRRSRPRQPQGAERH